jgi:hypothetical protein
VVCVIWHVNVETPVLQSPKRMVDDGND